MCDVNDVVDVWCEMWMMGDVSSVCDVGCGWCGEMWGVKGMMWDMSDVVDVWCEMWKMWGMCDVSDVSDVRC